MSGACGIFNLLNPPRLANWSAKFAVAHVKGMGKSESTYPHLLSIAWAFSSLRAMLPASLEALLWRLLQVALARRTKQLWLPVRAFPLLLL